jgi:hypothetical protein
VWTNFERSKENKRERERERKLFPTLLQKRKDSNWRKEFDDPFGK